MKCRIAGCNKKGKGQSGLCPNCFEVSLQADDQEENDLLVKILDHPVVDNAIGRLIGSVNNRIDQMGESLDQKIDQYASIAISWLQNQGQQKQQPQQPKGPSPREILGFDPNVKLTREMVLKRKREMAKIFHPDKSAGSEQMIRRINQAADELLKEF